MKSFVVQFIKPAVKEGSDPAVIATKSIQARNVDAARDAAREMAEMDGHPVRGVHVGPEGVYVIIATELKKPGTMSAKRMVAGLNKRVR